MTGNDLVKTIRAHKGEISVNIYSPRGGHYWVTATKKSLIDCFAELGEQETGLSLLIESAGASIVFDED